MNAAMLRLNVVRVMKGVLASTATKKLQDVLEAAFDDEGEEDDDYVPEEEDDDEEEEEEWLPEATDKPETAEPKAEASTSGIKRKAPPSSGASKRKASHSSKTGVCLLANASVYYPMTTDASSSYLHAGVDPSYYSSRQSSKEKKSAGYECQFTSIKKSEGVILPDCHFFSTTKGQLITHIRQLHLGLAIACYICLSKCWWSAATWKDHMEKCHAEIGSDAFYVKEGVDIEEFKGTLTIKKEVSADNM